LLGGRVSAAASTFVVRMSKPGYSDKRGYGDIMPIGMLTVVIIVSLIILAHLAVVIWLSFADGTPGDPKLAYTAKNFIEVFSDVRTYSVLRETLAFSLVSLLIALAFGLPAAWLAERTDLRGKTLLFTLMAIGLLIPGFAAAMGWLFLLHPRIGLVNQLLMHTFHLAGPPFNIISIIGMGWVQGLNLAPLAFIMTAALFGLAHHESSHLYALVVFPVGLALAGLREQTGSVKASILLHALNNLAAFGLALWGRT